MPRRTAPFLPDQYYHLYNRGNNRQKIFFERDNYLYFLQGIKKYIVPHAEILAYCLMPTHYHILIRIKTAPLTSTSTTSHQHIPESTAFSHAMQNFTISYTKAINKRFERVGALFQGQFHGKPVTAENHLLQLCIYIHANPVKDNLVTSPTDWEYSNYLDYMNQRQGTLVCKEFITENFGTTKQYKQLVLDYIKTRKMSDQVQKYLKDLED